MKAARPTAVVAKRKIDGSPQFAGIEASLGGADLLPVAILARRHIRQKVGCCRRHRARAPFFVVFPHGALSRRPLPAKRQCGERLRSFQNASGNSLSRSTLRQEGTRRGGKLQPNRSLVRNFEVSVAMNAWL